MPAIVIACLWGVVRPSSHVPFPIHGALMNVSFDPHRGHHLSQAWAAQTGSWQRHGCLIWPPEIGRCWHTIPFNHLSRPQDPTVKALVIRCLCWPSFWSEPSSFLGRNGASKQESASCIDSLSNRSVSVGSLSKEQVVFTAKLPSTRAHRNRQFEGFWWLSLAVKHRLKDLTAPTFDNVFDDLLR